MAFVAERGRLGGVVAAILGSVTTLSAPLAADELRIHGSSTFDRAVMQTYKGLIEQRSGHTLKVISSRSGLGLQDLVEGRADMAMLSAPFASEIEELRKKKPNAAYDRLRAFEVSRTRAAFVVHPANPVTHLKLDDVRRILMGEVTDWSELGGPKLLIRPVHVPNEGGVTQNVINAVLGGRAIANPNAIKVDTAIQVIKVVTQVPGAFGLAQLRLSRENKMKELVLDRPVTQGLSYVTNGTPSAAMEKVISATRDIVAEKLAESPAQ